MKILHSICNQ